MLWQEKLGGKLDFSKLTPCNPFGAEEGTRTPTGIHPLDPEPSASTSSATSAFK